VKCLLIEDSPLKADLILGYLDAEFPELTVDLRKSYQSGLKALSETPADFLILDMTLPNFDISPGVRHGKPRPLGGYEIMRKLNRKGICPSVLVLTQYESFGEGDQTYTLSDLSKKCETEFPRSFFGLEYFSSSADTWRSAIRKLIERRGADEDIAR
jgi:CheY-like chemotaxis protein